MALKSKMTNMTPARDRYSRKVKLLSGGRINGEFFPDGMVTIYPWDNQVDDWIQQRLQKGSLKPKTMLFNVLPRVCNLNGCRFENFIASEVMGVLMVARSILRNDVVSFVTECPKCGRSEENKVKIPDQLERVAEKTATWPGYDLIVLPDCQDEVKVRPVTVGEELAIMDRTDQQRAETCNDAAARVIAGLISVNDGKPDNAREAVTWFLALSPRDSDYLLGEFDKSQPALSNVVHAQCDECGHKFDHALRLNEDFFRRDDLASDRRKVVESVRAGVQNQGSGSGPDKGPGTGAPKAN